MTISAKHAFKPIFIRDGRIVARAFLSSVASSQAPTAETSTTIIHKTTEPITEKTSTAVIHKTTESPGQKQTHAKPSVNGKTLAELDEDLRQKMAAMVGDGGEAGVEYEDGKPVAMKRGVRENMFRYI
jgi:hypothetical protein